MAFQGSERAGVRNENLGGNDGKKACSECGEEVVEEKVEFEVCERWFHTKCAGVAVGTCEVQRSFINGRVSCARMRTACCTLWPGY
jgi:hypothetical protein